MEMEDKWMTLRHSFEFTERRYFTPLAEPVFITEQEWPENTLPLVTTLTFTYNHEPFIEDCIKGILTQKTTFPVQVLIHDDASADNTAGIMQRFQTLYPAIITGYYQSENVHNKQNKNELRGPFLSMIKGKYIALCEGDDYWTDPFKLQKQVSLLENNEDYQLVVGGYNRINCHNGNEKIIIKAEKESDHKQGYTFDKNDLTRGWLTKSLTAVIRVKSFMDYDISRFQSSRDVHMFYHVLQKGKGLYITEVLGSYRMHQGGVFSSQRKENKLLDHYQIYKEIYEVYGDEPARLMYIRFIKSLFSAGVVTWRHENYFSLIKEAAKAGKSVKEILLVIKSLLPVINQITKNGRISN